MTKVDYAYTACPKKSAGFNFVIKRTINLKSADIFISVQSTHIAINSGIVKFVNWMLENQKLDDNFLNKIILSDEAHFQLDGYVNTQNCWIWGTESPRVIHEKPLHAQRATVWCEFWAGGVIGPYFFRK
jgi:hypothetical protein